AIRALARAEGEGAKALIESVQKRWFVPGQVKTACEEALRRMAGKATTQGMGLPAARAPSAPPPHPPRAPAGSGSTPPTRIPSPPPPIFSRAPSKASIEAIPLPSAPNPPEMPVSSLPPMPPPIPDLLEPVEVLDTGPIFFVDEGASAGDGVLTNVG